MVKIQIIKKEIKVNDNGRCYVIKNPYSIRNNRTLLHKSLVIGFIGLRGSGKSVGATRMLILDYMLRGYRVWSNMPIEFTQIVNGKEILRKSDDIEKIKMLSLDEDYKDGVIFFDEANIEFFEAYRSMSKDNLSGSYMMQQLRHRGLSAIWTAQHETHVDTRLRFQTDIFIKCADISMMPEHNHCTPGAYSAWDLIDSSGVTGQSTTNKGIVQPFRKLTIWNQPWWNCYDTRTMQKKEAKQNDVDNIGWVVQCLRDELLINGGELRKNKWPLWQNMPTSFKVRLGKILPNYGIKESRDERKYILSDMVIAE